MEKPGAAVLVAVVAVSFSAILIRWSAADPLAIAFYRLLFNTVFLAPFVFLWKPSGAKGVGKRDLGIMVAVGFVLSLHFSLWITSLEMTSVASSVVLVTAHPLFVGLVSHYYLKDRLTRRNAIGIVVAFTGVVTLSTGDLIAGGSNLLGDVLAFAAGICAGVYILSGRKLRTRLSLLTYAFFVYGAATMFLLVYSLALGVRLWPLPRNDWILFIVMALIPGMLGHTLYNWSLKYVTASIVSVSLLGEPIGSSLLAYLIFNENPGPLVILGGAIVLAGIYLAASKLGRTADVVG